MSTAHAGVYALAAAPRTWRQRLMAAVLAGPEGSVASHRSAAALARFREGTPIEVTGSELEVMFLQLLRAAGVPEPLRQFEVHVDGQRFFLDFAYPERRLAIELDGRAHHGFDEDRQRQNALVVAGWTVLRFTWADVTGRGPATVATVVGLLRAA